MWAKSRAKTNQGDLPMLRWTLLFLLVAIIAGIFGFAGVMVAAAGIAKLLFYVFLVLFVVCLAMSVVSRA